MAIDGKKLVNYLAHGIGSTAIADALNLTPARVTQLSQEPKVIEAVAEKKKEIAESGLTEIADIQAIKKKLVAKMSDLADYSDSLGEVVTAYEKLDKIAALKSGEDDSRSDIHTIVMNAPVFLQQNHTINIETDSSNRVVAIQDRSMAPLPTKQVLELLKEGI